MVKPKKKMGPRAYKNYLEAKCSKMGKQNKKENHSFIELLNVQERLDVEGAAGADAAAGDDVMGESSMIAASPIAVDPSLLEFLDNTPKVLPSVYSKKLNDVHELEDLHCDFQRLPDQDLETIEFGGASYERRIVDLKYFLEELKIISNHSKAFGCGVDNLKLIGEQRVGLLSKLKFKCNMCNVELRINTSKPCPSENLNLNTAAVTIADVTGVGFTQLLEIFTSMNIPFSPDLAPLDFHLFRSLQNSLGSHFNEHHCRACLSWSNDL